MHDSFYRILLLLNFVLRPGSMSYTLKHGFFFQSQTKVRRRALAKIATSRSVTSTWLIHEASRASHGEKRHVLCRGIHSNILSVQVNIIMWDISIYWHWQQGKCSLFIAQGVSCQYGGYFLYGQHLSVVERDALARGGRHPPQHGWRQSGICGRSSQFETPNSATEVSIRSKVSTHETELCGTHIGSTSWQEWTRFEHLLILST